VTESVRTIHKDASAGKLDKLTRALKGLERYAWQNPTPEDPIADEMLVIFIEAKPRLQALPHA
jgi:hypothetical protein